MAWIRTVSGVLITATYLVALWFLVEPKLGDWEELKLNELGDFLAGVFGPLAIFWLVLGYFQQGSELRQNNAALKLQAQELQNSVEQQRELVAVTREQVTMEMESIRQSQISMESAAQPFFDFASEGGTHSGNKHGLRFSLTNLGALVTDINVSFQSSLLMEDRKIRTADRGAKTGFVLQFEGDWEQVRGLIHIDYITSLGKRGSTIFYATVEAADGGHPRMRFQRG